MMKQSQILRSHFVPQGPLGHSDSPLSQLGWGFHDVETQEISLSSSWLWRSESGELPRPRFSVGYPDEFRALEKIRSDLQKIELDLWIFRPLLEQDFDRLVTFLKENPSAKIIIAANHLLPWKSLIEKKEVQDWAHSNRAYLQFLPSRHELDPFLKPQEVLWEIEKLDGSFPLLVMEMPETHDLFYRTLSAEHHPLLLEKKKKFSFQFFMLLDSLGFRNLVLAFESFLGLLLEGQSRRIYQLLGRFFSSPAWGYKVPVFAKRSFDWAMDIFWYRSLFKIVLLVKLCLISIYIFLRHKLFPLLKQVIWYWGLFRLYVLIRYKSVPFFKMLLFPVRKIYWFLEFQYKKRIRGAVR